MAFTLSNIVDLSRIWLHDAGKSMLSDADAIIYANRGCLEITKEIGYPIQSGAVIDLPAGTGTAVASLAMPSDFVRFVDKDYRTAVSLYLSAVWTPLIQKERAEISSASLDSDTGTPTTWFPYNADATFFRQIGITPKYTGALVSGGVSLNYVQIPTALTALTSTGSANEMTEHFPIAIALFIAAEAWGKSSIVNKNSYLSLFRTYVAFAKRQEKNRYRMEAEIEPIMQKSV